MVSKLDTIFKPYHTNKPLYLLFEREKLRKRIFSSKRLARTLLKSDLIITPDWQSVTQEVIENENVVIGILNGFALGAIRGIIKTLLSKPFQVKNDTHFVNF